MQAESAAHAERRPDPFRPKIRSGQNVSETQDPNRNGTNLIVAASQRPAVMGKDLDEVTFGRRSVYLCNGPGKNPWVETEKGFVPVGTEDDRNHHSAGLASGYNSG